eukprot:7134210-Karenia_brevis.AAC.1
MRMAVPLSRLLAGGPVLHVPDLGGIPHGERLEIPAHLPPGTVMSSTRRPATGHGGGTTSNWRGTPLTMVAEGSLHY